MDNEQIIQEATEAVTKGLPCAFYVPLLLDVIKEQKASIDILGEANGKIAVAYQNAKSEAYREFAEKVKTKKFTHKNFGELVYVDDIDTTLNELTRNSHGTCTEK